MAPYVVPCSYDTAEELGAGKVVQAMWYGVHEDASQMAKLCSALAMVRREKKQDDFKESGDDEGA